MADTLRTLRTPNSPAFAVFAGIAIVVCCTKLLAADPPQSKRNLSQLIDNERYTPVERNFFQLVLNNTESDSERLKKITLGRFQAMRMVATFPGRTNDEVVYIFSELAYPDEADFAIQMIAAFVKDERIEHWQLICPSSAGIVSIRRSAKSIHIEAIANWIVRKNVFEYRIEKSGLSLVGSQVLAVEKDDSPFLH
ncbi:hypothetical protein, partial [Rhodopirellula bahusiensis]